jgi:glucuronoarabinoxylan endo-1,4-beta-xylanase
LIQNNQARFLKYLLPLLLFVMVLGVLQVNAANVTVTVNTATTYQTLDGFGAACAWYGDLLTGNSNKSAIYDLLFKNNLDILRIRNTYGSRNGATFCPYESELVSQGKSRNPNLKVFLVSWSPPTNLKANGALNGGTLAKVNNAFNYSGFGSYWHDSLVAYQGKGITPDYISIQNEPDYVNSGWETCQLDPSEGTNASYGKCLDAVVNSISSISSKPKIVGPEASYIANNLVQNYMNNLNQSNINVVGHHLYSSSGDANNPDSFISNMQSLDNSFPSKPKWQSEYDYGSALNHGIIIYNSLVYEQVSAYLFWDLVWTSGGTALITLPNLPASTYTVSDYYYVVKQFAGWTEPGYKRVAVSSNNNGVRATGFVNGNSLSIILINTSGSAATVNLNLDVNVSSSAIYQTTPGGSDKCAYKGSLGSGNTVTVANNSIATVVITTGGSNPPLGNLITNPDFETGNTNGWTVNGAGTIAISTAQKHSGTYNLYHTGRTAAWNGPLSNITSQVQNGKTYTCSGWVRLDNATSGTVIMTIKKVDGSGTTYTNVATGTGSNSSWVQLSGSYALNVTGTLTELSVYFEGPGSGVNYYLDDVVVQ